MLVEELSTLELHLDHALIVWRYLDKVIACRGKRCFGWGEFFALVGLALFDHFNLLELVESALALASLAFDNLLTQFLFLTGEFLGVNLLPR